MMKSLAAGAARALPDLLRDACGLAGAGAIAYGAWLVYAPAGYIVGGALVLVGVLMSSFGRQRAG